MKTFLLYSSKMRRMRMDWPPTCVVLAETPEEAAGRCGGVYEEKYGRKKVSFSRERFVATVKDGITYYEYKFGPICLTFSPEEDGPNGAFLDIEEVPVFSIA